MDFELTISEQELYKKIEELNAPIDIRNTAEKVFNEMLTFNKTTRLYTDAKQYIELITSLPWVNENRDIDFDNVIKHLDEKHYNMQSVKTRILEHIALMKINDNKQGSVILLAGPPGTGKTSISKSIAKALNRECLKISLSGLDNSLLIKGFHKSYMGALPGYIINEMKKSKENNPIFILDEIDKLGVSNSGDPSHALLEVLDPEQNANFVDNYLEIGYDLSQVLFIATANDLNGISPALLDRMEVITIEGYTLEEKFMIAKEFILPNIVRDYKLDNININLSDDVLKYIIRSYTFGSGVRGLRQVIEKLARNIAYKNLTNIVVQFDIDEDFVNDILGKEIIKNEHIDTNVVAGVANGLAVSQLGGRLLYIETSKTPGHGKLEITGNFGNIMLESAKLAKTHMEMMLEHELKEYDLEKLNINIHIAEGAISKDGPSAGIAMFTALCSLFLNKPVRNDVALTGEITLTGKVLAIGGLKEKAIAAYNGGVKTIIISTENESDILHLPKEIQEEVTFKSVKNTREIIDYLF